MVTTNKHLIFIEYIKLFLFIFVVTVLFYFIYSYNKTQTALLIKTQEQNYKLYKSLEAQSKINVISKKEIEKITKDIFSKEIIKEIKKQDEKIKAIHEAVIQFQDTIKDKEGAIIDTNNIWYSDKKIDIFAHRNNINENFKWDYTIRNDFKFNLLETQVKKNNRVNFRIAVTDNITGKKLPIQYFETKLSKELLLYNQKDKWYKKWYITIPAAFATGYIINDFNNK